MQIIKSPNHAMNCTLGQQLKEACPPCDDSPLSYAGNITGILTFALGLAASFLAFFSIIRDADVEIGSLHQIVAETKAHISAMRKHFETLGLRRDDDLELMQVPIRNSLAGFEEAALEMERHLGEFAAVPTLGSGSGSGSRSSSSSSSHWARRVRWWYRGKETAAKMATLESYNHRITAVQLTFLLR